MQDFIEAIDKSAENDNWYGALFIALSLPDICGKIEYPEENSSQRRYAAWFEKYVQPNYTHNVGAEEEVTVFLSGNDCYALRCAYLHEGGYDITGQRAREVVEKFHFIVAPPGFTIHCNTINAKLQLQIDIFCDDIKQGVLSWLEDIKDDEKKSGANEELLKIQFPDPGGGIRI